MIVLALDLSLTSSGYAIGVDGKIHDHGVIAGKGTGMPRMLGMCNQVMKQVEAIRPAFVVMEDLAFSMNKSYAKENAGNAYLIRAELFRDKVPCIVCASTSLKKFCTGSGSAAKELIIKEVLKRWGHDVSSNDVADALVLGYLGMALCGEWEPTMNQQREVLATVRKSNDLSFLTPNLKLE